jgi:hypothetical protein
MSDYFDRVERQIMRNVSASSPGRARARLGYLVPALSVLVTLAVAAVFVSVRGSGRSGTAAAGGVTIVYVAQPTPQTPVLTHAALTRTVLALRRRAARLGVSGASITIAGSGQIVVQLPAGTNVARVVPMLGSSLELAFYDWEGNAHAPTGQTVASQLLAGDVSALLISEGGGMYPPGSANAGGLPLYEAVELAAKQPAHVSRQNTRAGDQYYLFGAPGSAACAALAKDDNTAPIPGEHCLLAPPADVAARTSYSHAVSQLGPLPAGVSLSDGQVLVVKQGTVVLRAVPAKFATWPEYGSPATKYFVLTDEAALLGSEITNPEQSTDQAGQPDVSFGFTAKGANAFQRVTAKIANRGSTDSIGGQSLDQHFAVALDNQLLTVASIDFRVYPDGISGGSGAEIPGSFTASTAREIANDLRLGALPVHLNLISETRG